MKAILEFNLPEDQSFFNIACCANDLFLCVVEIERVIKNKISILENDINISGYEDRISELESLRDAFYSIINDNNCIKLLFQ